MLNTKEYTIITSNLSSKTYYITQNPRTTYVSGYGYKNSLGSKNNPKKHKSTKPIELNFIHSDILSIFSGQYHCFIIDKENNVWSIGSNNDGELGKGVIEYNVNQKDFGKILWGKSVDVKTIVIGEALSFFMMKNGDLYACGNNEYGQLGIGNDDSPIEKITEVELGFRVVDVCVGSKHSLFLNEKGEVYSTGINQWGQLGLKNTDYHYTPSKIDFGSKDVVITAIAAGHEHSVFLTSSGRVLTCGSNEDGALCYDKNSNSKNYDLKPRYIKFDKKVKKVFSGFDFTILLTDDNECYSSGNNFYGQCGIGEVVNKEDQEKVFKPTKVKGINEKIVNVLCGRCNVFFLSENDNIWFCGLLEHSGLLENKRISKEREVIKIPEIIDFKKSKLFE